MFVGKEPMGKFRQTMDASKALSWEDTLENILTIYYCTTLFTQGGQGVQLMWWLMEVICTSMAYSFNVVMTL
jgi:hypothetical protein